jgi:outer membrane protein TolC
VEQQYFTTLRDLAQARYAYLLAGLRMKALAGLLTDADMVGLGTQLATTR